MNDIKLQIGGKDVAANSGATFERKSPITGAVVSTCAAASAADARAACDAAAKAFPAWSALGPNARRKFLMEAAAKLRAHGADFSRLCVEETGAIAGWGHFNTGFAATLLEEAAAMTTQVIGETLPSDVPGTFAMGVRQAAGRLQVADPQKALREVALDGKTYTRPTDTGLAKTSVTASWQGETLVIATTQPYGGMPGNSTLQIRETWSLSPDGKVLTIHTTRELPAAKQTFNEIYNRD
mgnify:CR=1 FL=1